MEVVSSTPHRRTNLLITTAYLDNGGVEQVILTYARGLDKNLYNITVAFLYAGITSNLISAIPGVRTVHIATRSRIGRFFGFLKSARSASADIIHNHASWYGLLIAFFLRIPCVETVHNTYHWFTQSQRFMYGFLCRRVDCIVCVSENVRAFTLDFFPFLDAARCRVIYNGIEPDTTPGDLDAITLRQEYRLGKDNVVLGFAGRMTDQKGLDYLIDACGILNDISGKFHVVLVGDGERKGHLEERVNKSGLSNFVFTGFRPDVPVFMKMFDIFVLPSVFEGFPISILEAMAAGKPVVATRVGGVPESVEHGKTGLIVTPKNAQELAGALRELIMNPDKRGKMGEAGRDRLLERFVARTMIDQSNRLYTEILGK